MRDREPRTRREFLKHLSFFMASGTGAGWLAALARRDATARGTTGNSARATGPATRRIGAGTGNTSPPGHDSSYRISAWTGDDFKLCHQLRDRQLPAPFPDKAEANVDFVIVGGGMSGLSTAWFLKDHNFLLLESCHDLGGQSRGGTYHGLDYSWGAAYVDVPDSLSEEIYSASGLTPVEIGPEAKNAWLWDGHWCPGFTSAGSSGIYTQFDRLFAEAASVCKMLPPGGLTPENTATPEILHLDATRFTDMLKGLSRPFLSLIDSLCLSDDGGGINDLSALAGYAIIQDLRRPICVFPGGNSGLARALAARITASDPQRCRTGALVFQVELKETGASVVYGLPDGSLHRVNCRHVIVTTPPMVASLLIRGLGDTLRGNLLSFKYCSYLVANCLMPQRLLKEAYDNRLGSPFTFADVIAAEAPYMRNGSYTPGMGSVLTIYQPYAAGSPGRALLYAGAREALAKSIVQQLATLVAHLGTGIEEVVLSRWGHALPVAGTGYFARLQRIMASQPGACTLAHNSLQGLPSAEAAIRAARFAATRACSTHKTSILTGASPGA